MESMTVQTKNTEQRSLWQASSRRRGYPNLKGKVYVDVAIIGGGITGTTTALMLKEAGLKVALIEAKEIGYGVTGANSGHLTTLLLDYRYKNIIANFGEEGARLAAKSQQEAIQLIAGFVKKFSIDCDFQYIPGYLYAENFFQRAALKQEYKAFLKVDLQASSLEKAPLPFKTQKALVVHNQARFHPYKYIQALAEKIEENGSYVFENSQVHSVSRDNSPVEIDTAEGQVIAKEVVLATHIPIGLRPIIQSKVPPYRSYVIGARVEETLEDALYWDLREPYHYLRLARDDKGALLIIGGEDHRTGENKDTQKHFKKLEKYAKSRFSVKSIDYYWSAQLYESVDGLPYIGRSSWEKNVYVATGFSGEGLTCGTIAAQIIADQILQKENKYSNLFSPNRLKPLASAASFIGENAVTVGNFVFERLKGHGTELELIKPGDGKIVELDGHKAAVSRTEGGELISLSAVCPHAKCIVHWNNAEKSWDCPCHGSRFNCKGELLEGPALEGLNSLT